MTASVLKQDPNIKRFTQMLIYFNTDTQYAHFWGNPLYQATKGHLNNRKRSKTMKKSYLVLVFTACLVLGRLIFITYCVIMDTDYCFQISLVLISVIAIITYRVIMDIDYCPTLAPAECLMLTTVLSSILNAISILLLSKVGCSCLPPCPVL